MKDFNGKLALITGGSSGIGLAMAKKLSALGSHVWILARRPDRLEQASVEIIASRVRSDQSFGTLECDVADRSKLENVLGHFIDMKGAPDLLVNAAGYSYPQTFLNIPVDVFYNQMDVNYFGTVNTTRSVLPGMLKRNSGHIVNICSTAGFVTFYGFTAYSASKYALRGFSDALRSELRMTDIGISLCFPPATDSPGFVEENRVKPDITRKVESGAGLASPESVADSIIKGIRKNQYIILSGFENKVLYRAVNLLGKLVYPAFDFLVASAAKQTQGKPKN